MLEQNREEVLKLCDQDQCQYSYMLNPNADLGINPKEKIVNAVCRKANLKIPTLQNRSLTDGILKSYLSKYIPNGVTKSNQAPFDLRVGCEGTEFVLKIGEENFGGCQTGNNGTIVYAGVGDNCVVLEAYTAAFFNFANEQERGSLGEFVKTGFNGEAFNRTILAPYQGGLKVGTCTASCSGREVDVSVSGSVFSEDWNGCCDFEQSYKCELPKDALAAKLLDMSELDEALTMANQMVSTYVGAQPSTQMVGLSNVSTQEA